MHNMLTNLQRNPTLKIIHKSFWVFIKLRLKFCHFPRKMEDGRFKRDTGNELIPDVISRVYDVTVAILTKKTRGQDGYYVTYELTYDGSAICHYITQHYNVV